ncbi:unnamed protein product, partial [Sphagnum compactum]
MLLAVDLPLNTFMQIDKFSATDGKELNARVCSSVFWLEREVLEAKSLEAQEHLMEDYMHCRSHLVRSSMSWAV